MTLTREELGKAYQKIQGYRGLVIGKAIDIEARIDAILNLYLAKESKQHEFMHKVLDDEYFSFGLKIKILKKISLGLDKKFIEKIERVKNMRNEFAHRIPGVIPKAGPLSISFEDITKGNPKKIEELFEDFTKLIIEIEPELDKIFFRLVEENKKDKRGFEIRNYAFDIKLLSNLKDFFARICFIFLEKYFLGCLLQHKRVREEREKMKEDNSNWQIELRKLFLDIHFYLICWANIKKILRKLGKISGDPKFKNVLTKYDKTLNQFIEFRTYLEHFIDNFDNEKKIKLLSNPADAGNLENDFFTFGGKKLYIGEKNLDILDNLYNDVNEWLENVNRVEGVS